MINLISKLLDNKGFIPLNKSVAKTLGNNATILLTELVSLNNMHQANNTLDSDESFFATIEFLEEETNLTQYEQKECTIMLEAFGLIETKIKGIPARKFYKVNLNKITEILECAISNNIRLINIYDEVVYDFNKNIEKYKQEFDYKNNKLNFKNQVIKILITRNKNFNTNNNININNNELLSNDKSLSNNSSLLEKNKKNLEKKEKSKTLIKVKTSKKDLLVISLKDLINKYFSLNDKIYSLLLVWLDSLKQINKLPSERGLEMSLQELKNHNEKDILESIDKSIKGGYKTFYFNEYSSVISRDGINRNMRVNNEDIKNAFKK